MSKTTTIRIPDPTKQKLRQLVEDLGSNQNAVIVQLIDNARIIPIVRHEVVATLPVKTNRQAAQTLASESSMAVGS